MYFILDIFFSRSHYEQRTSLGDVSTSRTWLYSLEPFESALSRMQSALTLPNLISLCLYKNHLNSQITELVSIFWNSLATLKSLCLKELDPIRANDLASFIRSLKDAKAIDSFKLVQDGDWTDETVILLAYLISGTDMNMRLFVRLTGICTISINASQVSLSALQTTRSLDDFQLDF